ncbi:MAG: NimC/NimA family protein, partial [Firmicutes bacterium]|nr:NimC/NimA family protein [Bacillota bacterium]
YIQTGNVKNVAKQLKANPKAEICAMYKGEWIRIAGELVEDDTEEERIAAQTSMLEDYPSLGSMYKVGDGNTAVYYFRNATATISSFTAPPVVIEL